MRSSMDASIAVRAALQMPAATRYLLCDTHWKLHNSESSTLIIAPALSNSPQ